MLLVSRSSFEGIRLGSPFGWRFWQRKALVIAVRNDRQQKRYSGLLPYNHGLEVDLDAPLHLPLAKR